MKPLALHWRILIGMLLGVVVGLVALQFNKPEAPAPTTAKTSQDESAADVSLQEQVGDLRERVEAIEAGRAKPKQEAKKPEPTNHGTRFVQNWIGPFGTIFINLLKLIAIPLIVASLIKGISDLKDISKLSSMGGRTVVIFLCTTVVAVTTGLVIVNLVKPGLAINEEARESLAAGFRSQAAQRIEAAESVAEQPPLQPLIDVVPDNLVSAAANNQNMLQVIFFVVLFGIALVFIPEAQGKPVKAFFDGLNEVILKMIELVMLFAPIGVFALIANMVATAPSLSVLDSLLRYSLCVLAGLLFMIAVVYPTLVWFGAGRTPLFFLRGMAPAQLLAFSSSSSAATLPVTMECVEQRLGVDEEVSSFVLPIGATVNMDGTSLYQAVAAVFIAQVYGKSLDLASQLTIVLMATLASIGTAAVPGAGVVMLIIVLRSVDVSPEGIAGGVALILSVDRVLDMCRTVANITGDAAVSTVVAKRLGKLRQPSEIEPEGPLDEANSTENSTGS